MTPRAKVAYGVSLAPEVGPVAREYDLAISLKQRFDLIRALGGN